MALSFLTQARPQIAERLHLATAADVRPSIPLAINADVIRNLAAAFGLSDVRVFGSVVRGDDTSDSDVDVLARYDRTVPFFQGQCIRPPRRTQLRRLRYSSCRTKPTGPHC